MKPGPLARQTATLTMRHRLLRKLKHFDNKMLQRVLMKQEEDYLMKEENLVQLVVRAFIYSRINRCTRFIDMKYQVLRYSST